MSRLIKPRFLLVLALTAVLTAALACASEDDPTAAPAAPAARAAPAAPAVPTPDAAARARAVAEAELTELVVVAGQRVEIPKRVAPAAALSGTAVGDQTISTANAGSGQHQALCRRRAEPDVDDVGVYAGVPLRQKE